jgi:glutathione S-transferase
MKLYYKRGACSLTVRILINELNLACEYESVDLATKKTSSGADYLAINPKGKVPALVLDDHTVLTENTAIQHYLADTHPATHLLPAVGDMNRYKILGWLGFLNSDIHMSIGGLFSAAIPDDIKEKALKPRVVQYITQIDQHLQTHTYLHGESFTLPDAYLFVMLSWLPYAKLSLSTWPNATRYFELLKQRPSIVKSLQQEAA